ncbi:hypothetical protein T459_14229 [Capsicum annuum]|uniref:Uncharacterized protein n=1 Tax=Capsicum annuum TaxID=4072 RepID=A0A2G2ZH05_CAPAN|nr:hypothetical protein T459_14229 [Capsicum annuum]
MTVKEKGGDVVKPTTRKCYTSRNVVFGEASLWWSSDKEVLPESYVFKDMVQSSQIQLVLGKAKDTGDEDNVEEGVAQCP